MGAIDEMINAIARRETGAAITEFERKDFFSRYMPIRQGDSKSRFNPKTRCSRAPTQIYLLSTLVYMRHLR